MGVISDIKVNILGAL
ncbi:hypothetical protein FWK35_00030507 [Aphis craccivora]|uniref:Uncharacterized protein n=1 Tax=Aphis craccivora TaxID=307492 RepID=A0A6G0YTQ7_APHCR|nr:hypothetical protein FWK35_00030507 [Aphis craccivora]